MGFVIRSRRVLFAEEERLVVAPAAIHVLDSRIVRIERLESEAYEYERTQAGPRTIDLHDHLVTPTFVNAHTHLALAFLRGLVLTTVQQNLVENVFFRFERMLSAEDIRAFARMGAYESLLSGVGFVWDHYYGGTALADALMDVGLAGVVAPTVQDLDGPGQGQAEAALDATLQIAQSTLYRERGVYAALGPHATDTVSSELLGRVAGLAEEHGLPVHMHVAQSFEEFSRVHEREGCSPVELLSRTGVLARPTSAVFAHALFASRGDLARLDRDRHALAYCPSSQMEFGFPAPVALWSDLGVNWVVATDCAPSNDSMSVQKELRMARGAAAATITGSAAYERFLEGGALASAEETARARFDRTQRFARDVTSEVLLARVMGRAGALHPGVRTGVIAEGALANLIAWNTDHPSFWPEHDFPRGLAMGDTTGAIHALFVAGRRIGRIGDVTRNVLESDDYREARLEATERVARLLER